MQQTSGEVEAAFDAGGIGKEAAVQVGFQLEILRHRGNGRFGVQVLHSGKKGQVLPAAAAAVKTRFIAGNEAQMASGPEGPGQGIAALDEDAAFGGGKQGGDELHQGGLAGAVGAGDTEALPGKKLKKPPPSRPRRPAAGARSRDDAAQSGGNIC